MTKAKAPIPTRAKVVGISLFTGGGLFDVGMAKFVDFVAGFELEADIAEHASLQLGHPVYAVDVRLQCFKAWRGIVKYVHASPPCTRASRANATAGESPLDMELADAIIRALHETDAEYFTLENVWQYRDFKAFQAILSYLEATGWIYSYGNFDAADFGVPQHRERLMLRAWKKKAPLPPVIPTHGSRDESLQFSLFDEPRLPWNGWYAAIVDLLDTCPDSKLADWQDRRLTDQYGERWMETVLGIDPLVARTFLLSGGSLDSGSVPLADSSEPAGVVKASGKESTKALLVAGSGYDKQVAHSDQSEPTGALTTTVPAGAYRAVVVEDTTINGDKVGVRSAVVVEGDACGERCPSVVSGDEPANTVRCAGGGRVQRALLVDHNSRSGDQPPTVRTDGEPAPVVLSKSEGGRTQRALLVAPQTEGASNAPMIRDEGQPSTTLAASDHQAATRAILCHGANASSNGRRGHDEHEPAFTLSASDCGQFRAIYVRVVALTTRCLARFQSLPDWYDLPKKRSLATKIIGNGIPCLFAEKVFGSLFESNESGDVAIHSNTTTKTKGKK